MPFDPRVAQRLLHYRDLKQPPPMYYFLHGGKSLYTRAGKKAHFLTYSEEEHLGEGQESARHLQERGSDFSVSRNYSSYEENREDSLQEMKRLISENHLEEIGTWQDVLRRWPGAMATRIARPRKMEVERLDSLLT